MQGRFFQWAMVVVLICCGCSVKWQHPTKSRAELQRDLEYCQRDVREFRKELTGKDDPYNEQVLINDCLRRKGWYR